MIGDEGVQIYKRGSREFQKRCLVQFDPYEVHSDHLPILPRSIVVANGTEIEAFSSMQALLSEVTMGKTKERG